MKRTVGNRRIDALLIYIGTNDMGLASTLEAIVSGDNPVLGSGDPTEARLAIEREAVGKLARLRERFVDLADAIARDLNVRHVYLTECRTHPTEH